MKKSLVLSLGHNSSAIYLEDNNIVAGYEEERLSLIKSDSSFPIRSINLLRKYYNLPTNTDIYIGHWDLYANVNSMKPKHWNPDYLANAFPDSDIFSLHQQFTHHDSHAYSAIAFAGQEFADKATILVIDGFGSFSEHISLYSVINGHPILGRRFFGFGTSLGLFYQYATSFMGLKQNQDEYKLLAFESRISEVKIDHKILEALIKKHTDLWLENLAKPLSEPEKDPVLSYDALPNTAIGVHSLLTSVLADVKCSYNPSDTRTVLSYFVQSIVERVITELIKPFNIDNLIVVGGVFYNVKVNHMISKLIKGQLCIMPLAGDQGAGLGVYKSYNFTFKMPNHLFWGRRKLVATEDAPHLYVVKTEVDAFQLVDDCLRKYGVVNLIRGNMEFGPRALCNTSTLALPTIKIANFINHCNDRVNEMPFAPIVREDMANSYFRDVDKIYKSLEYMICTREYKFMEPNLMGAAHKIPNTNRFTGRPQLVTKDDPYLYGLLGEYKLLINTSFNYHGVPIAYDMSSILNTHIKQGIRAKSMDPIRTIVVEKQE